MNESLSISIIIRTLNEAQHLDALLRGIKQQRTSETGCRFSNVEVVVVDSGSTDSTIEIAQLHKCRITYITKKEFTFGGSLNRGCDYSSGEFLVFVSGHCIPTDEYWLARLISPLLSEEIGFAYGRQHGVKKTRFSELRIFRKYFPPESSIPQSGFFCNNANSALRRDVWKKLRFDETLTGLEDIDFARKMSRIGGKVAYVADAGVFHIHDETWKQVWRRFEREAVALQLILPEVRFGVFDLIRCLASGIIGDFAAGARSKVHPRIFVEVVLYRSTQYIATWFGARRNRAVTETTKLRYYYPDVKVKAILNENSSITAHEGEQ